MKKPNVKVVRSVKVSHTKKITKKWLPENAETEVYLWSRECRA